MKHITFVLFTIIAFCQCSFPMETTSSNNQKSNPSSSYPKNAKAGACYAKCMFPTEAKKIKKDYIIYTGDLTAENIDIIKKTILVNKSEKWEKRKADRNCYSSDPNDCLVWCLVTDSTTRDIIILKDTTQSKAFKIETIESEVPVSGGFSDWQEVLCDNKVKTSTIRQIQEALKSRGYNPSNILDSITYSALIRFQKDNDLPIGGLNLKTLDALGVKY